MNIDLIKNKIDKIMLILPFIFFILALIIITMTPLSDGYELSIYDSYPLYFWIFLVGGIFSAALILIREIFTKSETNRWIIGFSAILFGNLIFLLLPYFRGYFFNGGANADIFSHIGWIREITISGHVFENNFYPIIHIFTVVISDTLGISINKVLWFIPAFFSILYVLFMLLLARIITKDKKNALVIVIFSIPLIFSNFHTSMHPAFFSFTMLPLLLYLYHKRNLFKRKFELTVLLISLCLFIVFFHPMTTLICTVIFGTIIGSTFVLRKSKSFLHNNIEPINRHMAANIILILTVCFFTWYTAHRGGLVAIKSIWQGFVYGSEFTMATHYLSVLGIANLTILQTVRLFVLRYGAVLLYGGLSFLLLALIGKKFIFLRKIKNLEFLYGMQIITAFLTAAAMMVTYFIITNPIRSALYFLMISTIFNGLVIYFLLIKNKDNKRKIRSKILPNLVIFMFFFSSMVCILNIYPSPITWQPNQQFTHMNYAGSAWITEKRDIRIQVSQDIGFNLLRMEHYINGIDKGDKRMLRMGEEPSGLPPNFGYDDNDTLFEAFNLKRTYVVTTENGRQGFCAFPINVQDKCIKFTCDDFNKLCADKTVNKVYENGELECWLVGA